MPDPRSVPAPVIDDAFDWAATPFGAAAAWPSALRTAAGMVLHSRQPMCVMWGPELRLLFNDGYRTLLGARAHDGVMGQPFRAVWPELAGPVGPMLDDALRGHATGAVEDQPFVFHRNGYPEPVHVTFFTSPIHADEGRAAEIAGLLVTCLETTARVAARRERDDAMERLRLLDEIGEATRVASEPRAIMEEATRLLGEHLGVTRVAYADLEADNDRFTIRHDWRVPGAISTTGVYSLDLFGSQATSNLRIGRTLVISDVDRELAPGDGDGMFNSIGIKAIICCPLVKGGRLVAMMAVHQAHPRGWTAEELALVEAVVERCWAHIERVRSTEALREADRHKSEFLAVLAHELRNPLAPIRNGLELLRLGDGGREQVARVGGMMDRQLSHMTHLIDDLLDIARVSSGKIVLHRELADLKRIVSAAIEGAMPAIGAAGHDLAVDMPDAPLPVDADPVRISQVIGNLLTNAAKYTPRNGRIRVAARVEEGTAVVSVSDNGIGIPPESLDAVFDMFTQVARHTERSNGGLGIGLSLVRRLVALHGGTATAASAGPGHGSTFTIRLPLADALQPAADAAPAPPLPAPAAGRPLRILIADDNVDAARSLADLLALGGHDTRVAADGAGALELAAAFHPDVAFLDIGMPGMDGYETARCLRGLPGMQSVRLAALTGWGAAEDRERSRAAGFDHHLLKPAVPAEVSAVLAAA
ncbi:hybrid sensor histidine kinase/response regulator [Pseudoduganella umbonata]|uniref:histidine kinase n=1 Tax=Pseudoduganella umbonata TaxID=864828 RepID=A0A4P8HMJ3_9BURK|nr:ATP-binding protein [Pseudoduganella umbonata]MBB3221032.1 signal transduction histidine kinase [Pseudoduganella umbonata]QCP10236.1 response regulator [Pseudoduganella umbonata]